MVFKRWVRGEVLHGLMVIEGNGFVVKVSSLSDTLCLAPGCPPPCYDAVRRPSLETEQM
jgi:hypothetical protein